MKFPLAGADGAKRSPHRRHALLRLWFTEEAVLIDTAGRYTTQDSDSEADKKSWLSFLSLLKSQRAKQPINGVILAISIEDMLKLDGQELNEHAVAIRKRLLELHQQLKIDFPGLRPVHQVRSARRVLGVFRQFHRVAPSQVWGATFQTEDRKKNMVGEVSTEFDLLVRRLTEEEADRPP